MATAFVFYCDAKHSDILRGSKHVFGMNKGKIVWNKKKEILVKTSVC